MIKYFVSVMISVIVVLAACTSPQQARTAQPQTAAQASALEVHHVGDRRVIIEQGDLEGRISLDSIAHIPHLYAVGPLAGLKGEITVWDGTPSIVTVVDDRLQVSASLDHQAIFLVYASAPTWKRVTVDRPLRSHDEVESFVRAAAADAGLDAARPFVFRLEGHADTLQYHVMNKTDDAKHDREAHEKVKKHFALADAEVQVLGFWADAEGEGVYTHPGKRTHLHFRLPDDSASGHLDEIGLRAGSTLYLPE